MVERTAKRLGPREKAESLRQSKRCCVRIKDKKARDNFTDSSRSGRRQAKHYEESYVVELPSDVVQVLEEIENAKREREQIDVRVELETIMERIEEALKHAGDDGKIPRTLKQKAEFLEELNCAPDFELAEKRKELNRQQDLLSTIARYAENLHERKNLTHEVDDWLESTNVVDEKVLSKNEMDMKQNEYQDINNEIREAFAYAKDVVERIRKLGYQLLKDAGYIDSDDEDDGSGKRKKKNRITMFDFCDIIEEKMLTESPESLEIAMAEIKTILEQGIRMVKKQDHKNVLRAGVKQMKFIIKAVLKRIKESKKKDEEILHLKAQLDSYGNNVKRYKEEIEKKQLQIQTMENKIEKLDVLVHDLKQENEELQMECEELRGVLENGPKNQPSTWSAHVTFSNANTKSCSSVKSVHFTDSMLSTAAKTLQNELDNTNKLLKETEFKLANTQKELKATQLELEQLKAKVEMEHAVSGETSDMNERLKEETTFKLRSLYDDNASLEKQVALLLTEVNCKNELIEYQERRLKEMKEELGIIDMDDLNNAKTKDGKPIPDDMKHTLFRIRKEYTSEINRLQSHIEKEKSRHDAAVRKLEQKHKEDMNATFKQSVHLLRAINRFKESIAIVLDREHLPVAASDVRRVPDLPTQEGQAEAKLLLAQMAGGAVELLVNVEFKLSQALLNKRLEVKDNSIAKTFANRDLEAQMEVALKAKLANESMANTLKEMKMKLLAAEETISVMRKFENWRYEALNKRYRKLMAQYNSTAKDKSRLEREYKRTLKDIEKKMKTMISRRDSMVQMMEEQQDIITQMHEQIKQKRERHSVEYQLTIAEQKKNLKLIEKAHKDNKLSKDMYEITVELVKKSMELPLIKLRSLFQRYITYRRLKNAREQLERESKEQDETTRKAEIISFLSRVDHKITKSAEEWCDTVHRMEEKRTELFDKMAGTFSTIVQETGVLLVAPKQIPQQTSDIEAGVGTEEAGELLTHAGPGFDEGVKQRGRRTLPKIIQMRHVPELPAELAGKAVELIGWRDPVWERANQIKLPPIQTMKIDTPHILEYDVNRHMISARKTLARMYHKAKYPVHDVRGYEYSHGSIAPLSDTATYFGSYGDSDSSTQETSNYASSLNDSETIDSGIISTDSRQKPAVSVTFKNI